MTSEINDSSVSPSLGLSVPPSLRLSVPLSLRLSDVQTASGLVLGTAQYMSPEQARGQEVDERTDIFSLGVLIYEMIAGRRPFEGATRAEIIRSLIEREPPPLDEDVPADLREIVSRALRKDRAERYQSVYNWMAAEAEFKRAIELDSKNAIFRAVYADFLSTRERFTEAIAQAQRAQELDPISVYVSSSLAKVYYNSRDYDRALEGYRKMLELDQDSTRGRRDLGRVLLQRGQHAEAIEVLSEAVARKSDPDFISDLAYAYAVAGRRGEARRMLAQLHDIARRRYVSRVYIAKVYAGLGETAEALALLNQALRERSDQLTGLRVDPAFDQLRNDPRFVDLLRRVGLTQ
ncbi:MAG: tetratricopeptide repeat protein [Acidobacteria bacterium]|nr:tetratricopeptide repeat protein [Acidobacteriota bacterium]